jgi:hypothetical protein
MRRKDGRTMLRRCASKLAKELPYSKRPPSRLTANDMSDGLVGTPRWSNRAIRLG